MTMTSRKIDFSVVEGKLVVGYTDGSLVEFEGDDELQKAEQRATLISNTVIHVSKRLSESVVLLGMLMKSIRDEKLYATLQSPSFESWIEENGFDRTNVYRYIKVVEKFMWELGLERKYLEGQSVSKLDVLAPHINSENREELLGWLPLSRSDIIRNIHEKFRKEPKRSTLKDYGFEGVFVLAKSSVDDIDGEEIVELESTKVRVFNDTANQRLLIKTFVE